ncbi:hypothetical protein ACIO3O_00195 [Streptomyces sp. NPDC087440]
MPVAVTGLDTDLLSLVDAIDVLVVPLRLRALTLDGRSPQTQP